MKNYRTREYKKYNSEKYWHTPRTLRFIRNLYIFYFDLP